MNQRLQEKNLEVYCPLQKVRRKWSDRMKTVEEPLFKGYVFVKVDEVDLAKVRMVNGVVNIVYWNGKPAQIRESEIIEIKKFLNDYEEVECLPLDLDPGTQVMIKKGMLMDQPAVVRKVMGQQVEVLIESLGFRLIAKVPKSNLVKP